MFSEKKSSFQNIKINQNIMKSTWRVRWKRILRNYMIISVYYCIFLSRLMKRLFDRGTPPRSFSFHVRGTSGIIGGTRGDSGWRVLPRSRGFVGPSVYGYHSTGKHRGVVFIGFLKFGASEINRVISEWTIYCIQLNTVDVVVKFLPFGFFGIFSMVS